MRSQGNGLARNLMRACGWVGLQPTDGPTSNLAALFYGIITIL
jgi:hypothetical protein